MINEIHSYMLILTGHYRTGGREERKEHNRLREGGRKKETEPIRDSEPGTSNNGGLLGISTGTTAGCLKTDARIRMMNHKHDVNHQMTCRTPVTDVAALPS